jgi:hypothetical protein
MKYTSRRKIQSSLWLLLFILPLLAFLPGCSAACNTLAPTESAVAEDHAESPAEPGEMVEAAEPEIVQSSPEAIPPTASSAAQTAASRQPSSPPPAQSAGQRPAPQSEPVATASSTYDPEPSRRSEPDMRTEVITPPSAPRQGDQPVRTVAEPPPPPPEPVVVQVPAGAVLEVRLAESLSTSSNESGDRFETILDQDLIVDGEVVARQGTLVRGRLLESVESGKVKGRARMELTLTHIDLGGEQRLIRTNSIALEAEGTQSRDAKVIGGAAAVGAVIGAIAGGRKGAAIGGATGGGAGTAGVLLTRGKEVELNKEQLFSFRIEEPFEVRIR